MISNQVTPFLLRFARRLSSSPPAAPGDEADKLKVTCPETRLTKVLAETTDDA